MTIPVSINACIREFDPTLNLICLVWVTFLVLIELQQIFISFRRGELEEYFGDILNIFDIAGMSCLIYLYSIKQMSQEIKESEVHQYLHFFGLLFCLARSFLTFF